MKLKNESGFSPVEIVAALLIVVVIAFIGVKVLGSNSKDSSTSAANKTATSATTSDKQTSGATKYLEISQWGVKFALTTDTADAYYDANTSSSMDSMSLRVHSLDSESDCKNNPQSIAAIFRVAKDAEDSSLPGKKYSETQDGKTIGNYFYFIQGAQYGCTVNTEKAVILQGVRNSFDTAGPSIQKI